jgi:hypothetical protein
LLPQDRQILLNSKKKFWLLFKITYIWLKKYICT